MSRCDGHEKSPVETAVARAHGAKTSVGIEFHGCSIAKTRDEYSPFSDLYFRPRTAIIFSSGAARRRSRQRGTPLQI
jgi:hypothetical protein